jgi:hypothetical protein
MEDDNNTRAQQHGVVCGTFRASPIFSIDSLLRHDVASRQQRQKLYNEHQKRYTDAQLSHQIRNRREQEYMLSEQREKLDHDLFVQDARDHIPMAQQSHQCTEPYRTPPRVKSVARRQTRENKPPKDVPDENSKRDLISDAIQRMLALENLERPANNVLSSSALRTLRDSLRPTTTAPDVVHEPAMPSQPTADQAKKETPRDLNLLSSLPRAQMAFGR